MARERKELSAGGNVEQAINEFVGPAGEKLYDPAKHEIIQCNFTGLYQIFNRRRKTDRTVKRPIKRYGTKPYGNGKDHRPIVLIVLPGEQIILKLKGRRKGYQVAWSDVYHWRARVEAQAAINERNKAKLAKAKKRSEKIRKRMELE